MFLSPSPPFLFSEVQSGPFPFSIRLGEGREGSYSGDGRRRRGKRGVWDNTTHVLEEVDGRSSSPRAAKASN